MDGAPRTIVWEPQSGPQQALIECPVFEVFFGGARGGGKTEGSIGDWLQHAAVYGGEANGIFVRRTAKQLEEVIARTKRIYPLLGAKFREQKGEWVFPSGARQKFRYLERDTDAEEYQGHSYTWLGVEEITNFPDPSPIDKMRATLRSGSGVKARMVATGNPGGPGHAWVKKRYIDPAPQGCVILRESFKNPFTHEMQELERTFIPSRLSDNPLLMTNDPFYVARLQQQGSAQLVKAWLEGDWDIVLGAFFELDTRKHVLSVDWQAIIPRNATRFRAFDWGSAKPFSCGWYAVSDGTWGLPKNALFKYREWYGTNGQANVGLKMFAETVAEGIRERDDGETIRYSIADPQIFVRDGGPSIAERMAVKRVVWRPGDRKRKVGWDMLRGLLAGDGNVPLLYFSETCVDTIRTLQTIQHDEKDSEDLDTDQEDHAADETRYAVMSRAKPPREDGVVVAPMPLSVTTMTMGQIWQRHLEKSRAKREEEETV